jgi:hypothetical protein
MANDGSRPYGVEATGCAAPLKYRSHPKLDGAVVSRRAHVRATQTGQLTAIGRSARPHSCLRAQPIAWSVPHNEKAFDTRPETVAI